MADGSDEGAPRGWGFYGITTADRPERAAHLDAELRRAGIRATVHASVRPDDAFEFAGVGIRGCFESHLHCLRAALADGVEVAVLVEDDVVLVGDLGRRLAAVAAELGRLEWSMAYLGHLGGQSPARTSRLRLVAPHVAAADGWEMIGAHLLAVRASALPALIDDLAGRLVPGGHQIPVDGAYNEFRRDTGAATFLCVPNLALQAPSPSGITERAGLRQAVLDVPAARRLLLGLRRATLRALALVPPTRWVTAWNLRASVLGRAGRPDRSDPGPVPGRPAAT